jgi:hypothetical protein
MPVYERLYAGRDYLGKAEQGPVQRQVAELRRQFDVRDRRTIRLEEQAVDPTWVPDVEGPSQLELPLAPGEQPPASLAA